MVLDSALVFSYFPAELILQKVNLPIYFGLMFWIFNLQPIILVTKWIKDRVYRNLSGNCCLAVFIATYKHYKLLPKLQAKKI
jgi:hypothetical protein